MKKGLNLLRGYYRLCLCGLLLSFWGGLIVLTAWIPLKIKGIRLTAWLPMLAAKNLLQALGMQAVCTDRNKVFNHNGFLFANHLSFVDILVLLSLAPVRFVAKVETLKVPIIGQAAKAIGCVFVDRSSKASRVETRHQLAEAHTYPSIVIFPEGTRGPGDKLLPLRHGAFEIAIQGAINILPCAITYTPVEAIIWQNKALVKGVWRLVSRYRGVVATVTPLEVISTQTNNSAAQLADITRAALTAVVYPLPPSSNSQEASHP